jgi:hypothetical protein
MQLSLLAPFAVIVYLLWPSIGVLAVSLLWIASIAVGAQTIVSQHTSALFNATLEADSTYRVSAHEARNLSGSLVVTRWFKSRRLAALYRICTTQSHGLARRRTSLASSLLFCWSTCASLDFVMRAV